VPQGFALVHDAVGRETHHLLVPFPSVPAPEPPKPIGAGDTPDMYYSWPEHNQLFSLHCMVLKAQAEPLPLLSGSDDAAHKVRCALQAIAVEASLLSYDQLRYLDVLLQDAGKSGYVLTNWSPASLATLLDYASAVGSLLSYDANRMLDDAGKAIRATLPRLPEGPYVSLVAYSHNALVNTKRLPLKSFRAMTCGFQAHCSHTHRSALTTYAHQQASWLDGQFGSVLIKLINVPQSAVHDIALELATSSGLSILRELCQFALPLIDSDINWFVTSEVDVMNRPVINARLCDPPALSDTTYVEFFFSSDNDIGRGCNVANSIAMYLINVCQHAWAGKNSKLYFVHFNKDRGLSLPKLFMDDFWVSMVGKRLAQEPELEVDTDDGQVFPVNHACAFALVTWNEPQFTKLKKSAQQLLKVQYDELDFTSVNVIIPSIYQ
jgi:hypothetical protein